MTKFVDSLRGIYGLIMSCQFKLVDSPTSINGYGISLHTTDPQGTFLYQGAVTASQHLNATGGMPLAEMLMPMTGMCSASGVMTSGWGSCRGGG